MEYDIRKILYATDLGPHGPVVANHAVRFAPRFNARIHVVHVIKPLQRFTNTLVERQLTKDSIDAVRAQAVEEARDKLQQAANRYFEQEVFKDTDGKQFFEDIRVVEGPPARTILKESKRLGVNLVVLGHRGYNPLSEMLMGSVAQK